MADQAEKLQSPAHLQAHSCPVGLSFVRFPLRSLQIPDNEQFNQCSKKEYYFLRKTHQSRHKRKRLSPQSLWSAINKVLLVTVCFLHVNDLNSHTMISTELTFHIIDRTLNKNTLMASHFKAPVMFIHFTPVSMCSSYYNPDVSSWPTRALHL